MFRNKMIPALCLILSVILITTSCRKDQDILYQVTDTGLYPTVPGKNKLKSESQYISILYANLFQKALSSNKLVEITNVIASVGDKELIHEVIISNFMNEPDIIFPSNATMRKDIDKFIEETYKRFLVRKPTELEKTYFRNYINSNSNVTPELVYFAFSLSNEYLFY